MNPTLDFGTNNKAFNVYAYDARYQLAVIEDAWGRVEKPFKVVTEFEYSADYTYQDMYGFHTLDEALAVYDGFIEAIKKGKK